MTNLHRSITPRTLHLQRRDAAGRTAVSVSVTGMSTTRADVATVHRMVVPRNAGQATEAARSGASAPSAARTAPRAAVAEASAASRGTLPVTDDGVSSENLLRGAKVVRILHNGESYQLRATRHGKLILTK